MHSIMRNLLFSKNTWPIALSVFILFLSACFNPSGNQMPDVVIVTEVVEVTRLADCEIPSTSTARSRTYPSGDTKDFEYQDSDCVSSKEDDIERCAAGMAFNSARELDHLLLQLDQQYPEGKWETTLADVTISQNQWESLKVAYCEYDAYLSQGGYEHSIHYWTCIDRENRSRAELVETFACMLLDEFSRCPKE